MAVTVKVHGAERLEQIAQNINKFPEKLIPLLRKTSNKVAIVIQGEARKLSPIDTGRLRSSIAVSLGINFLGAIVGTDVEYAEYVHEGTGPHIVPVEDLRGWARRKGIDPYQVQAGIAKRGTQAQPFMEDAIKNKERDIRNIFESALNEGLEYLKP